MCAASNRWGVELNGTDEDKRRWRLTLKPPFDPHVEEVEDDRGDYLVLRSSAFDGLDETGEVHAAAKELFPVLNVTMAKHVDADPVNNGAVVEFIPDKLPRRHHILEAESGVVRIRGSIAELTVRDADGNVIKPPPAPSIAQLWLQSAVQNQDIASALKYMQGNPGWVDLYKAYEALSTLPDCGISKIEMRRFTQTANVNVDARHHPKPNREPHPKPMGLHEARDLIMQWISAAIEDDLAKKP